MQLQLAGLSSTAKPQYDVAVWLAQCLHFTDCFMLLLSKGRDRTCDIGALLPKYDHTWSTGDWQRSPCSGGTNTGESK